MVFIVLKCILFIKTAVCHKTATKTGVLERENRHSNIQFGNRTR